MLFATLRLFMVVLVAGVGLFPLARRVTRSSPDTAWPVAKYLGFLPALFLIWMSIQAGPGRIDGIWCWALLLVTLVVAWSWDLRSGESRETIRALVNPRNIAVEVVFAVLLLFFAWVLHFNPAIDPDTERFMDYALLEAVITDPGFPPQDPWFAGEPLQYYYFGYYWVGMTLALAGLDSLSGFVPVIALVYALFGCLVFAFGRTLRGRETDGLLALFLVLFSGNLKSCLQFLAEPSVTGFDWFAPSRVIPGTINEFPYFSFLWGDLHPYVVGFPLFAFLLLRVLEAYRGGLGGWRSADRWVSVLALGLVASINSWDFPVMAMLLAFALYHHRTGGEIPRFRAAGTAVGTSILLGLIGLAPFLSYLLYFRAGDRSLGWVQVRTVWSDYLAVHGTHWIVLTACTIAILRSLARNRWPLILLSGVLLSILTGSVAPGLFLVSLLAWWFAENSPPGGTARLGWSLVAGSMLLSASVELVYVDDLFHGEIERIVTVFKVYLQAWIVLSLACAALLASVGERFVHLRRAVVALLLIVGSVYPIAGTVARIRSLGDARASTAVEHLQKGLGPEYAALSWLTEYAEPGEVVLEAPGRPYTWSGRLAALSQLATPLAWDAHQATWRNSWQPVRRRQLDVDLMFSGADPAQTETLLKRYRVRYVMFGGLERERYGPAALDRIRSMGETVIGGPEVWLIRLPAG